MVSHHRIHQTQGVRVIRIQTFDNRDLFGGTEETGIHAVQIDVLLAPRIQIAVQNFGRIVEREHAVARMRRKQRRRHGAYVASGRRQNRNGRRQRALAVTAHVVHRGHTWNVPWVTVEQNHIIHGNPLSRLPDHDFSRLPDFTAPSPRTASHHDAVCWRVASFLMATRVVLQSLDGNDCNGL